MIVKTTKEVNGVIYDYTYSDSNMMIERNGEMYSEAVDPVELGRTYIETNVHIEAEVATETEQKAKAYDILTGVSE